MNQIIFWLVLLVVLVVIEIATLGLTTIWFAGGALVALIAAAFGAPLYFQVALFIAVSAVLLFFTRPLAVRYFNNDRVNPIATSEEVFSVLSAGIYAAGMVVPPPPLEVDGPTFTQADQVPLLLKRT